MSVLLPLFDGSKGGLSSHILNIIVLPEIGTRTPQCTINCFSEIQPSSRIFEFRCDLYQNEFMIWAALVEKAKVLMEAILQQPELSEYPTVFVCHGLSGIIAKWILSFLDERYNEYKAVLDAQAGIAFVSTPHLTESKQDGWSHLNFVLRSCPGFSKWQTQNELQTIANVCIKFDKAQIENPILSVYEKRPTKIGEGWRHKKTMLVDKEFAQIGAKDESLEAVDADHLEIFAVNEGSDLCQHFKSFFDKVHGRRMELHLQMLGVRVQTLSIAADDEDKDTWASSVYHSVAVSRSGKGPEDRERDSRHVSVDATRGTSERPSQEGALAITPDTTKSRPSLQLPCRFLGPHIRNPEFAGRDDILKQMDSVLTPDSQQDAKLAKSPRTFVLSGLGGVGKTQCALEYAISREKYFDAILWAHADTNPKLDESFSQISVALGLEQAVKAGDRVISRNLVLEWLSNPVKDTEVFSGEIDPAAEKAKWLLIFDNADDPTVLVDFLPSSTTGAIIVTSRDPLVKKYFHSNGVHLEPLTTSSAARLLRKLTDVDDNPHEIEFSLQVAKRLGGLPLAIKLAAAAILRHELTFEEFLAFYEAEPLAADVRPITLRPENQYQHTLSTVWALDVLEKTAHSLLCLLSVLDPDGIDERIITQSVINKMPSGYPVEQAAFLKARASLLKSSLIKRDKPTSQIIIHRLTQDFTRVKMSFEMLKEYFGVALLLCMQFWPIPVVAVSYSVANWPASEAVVPHLIFLRKLWKSQPSLVHEPFVKQQLADLTWRVAWYFTERGSAVEDVEGLLLSSHEICEAEDSLRLSDTHSQALFALSSVYFFENDPRQSLTYALINLDISLNMNKDPKISQFLGLAYNAVGMAMLSNDRWKDAETAFRHSIRVYGEWVEVTQRGFRPEFPWGGLAIALSEMGDHKEAASIFLETIRHREQMFGPADTDSIKLGWALQGLGGVRLKQGRLDESFEAYKSALANYKITSGPRYFRTGQVLMKIGEHYSLRRQYSEADTYFEQAITVFQNRKAYKGEHARILHLQGKMRDAKGQTGTQADDFHSKALRLYSEVVRDGKLSVFGATLADVDFDKAVAFWAR